MRERYTDFVEKLKGTRDLKKILETTVKELGEIFVADCCQIMLSNPLDPNVTSICEFRAAPDEELLGMPFVTLPLVLHGRTFGSVSMSRPSEINQDEVNSMRVILGELGDLIRHAQINDVVQRDTFRDTFLVEIGNLMGPAYSLGIGDALFMVVNILGKVLQASRCLFICTDDTQAGWKCYEFWQQEKVQSCQDYRWPTTDSPLVAQTLLSESPLKVFEGQQNSYVSPVQEELQFIGVKSLLGIALRSSSATHGCVILQQCDYRRSWTRNEIDMVQNVADKVADALYKLPAEKRAREPIMQLHQRIVQVPEAKEDGKASYDSVRKALKGALGQQAIPSARSSSAPPAPPAPAKKPVAPAPVPSPSPETTVPNQPVGPAISPIAPVRAVGNPGAPTISPVQSKSANADAATKSLGSILNPAGQASAEAPPAEQMSDALDPYADLDFGDFGEMADAPATSRPAPTPMRPNHYDKDDPDTTWGNLDALKPPPGQSLQPQPDVVPIPPIPVAPPPVPPPPTPAPALAQTRQNQFETIPPGVVLGSHTLQPLQPPTPAPAPAISPVAATAVVSAPPAGNAWGDLDSIQAPAAPPARAGLSGSIMGKARASSGASPLMASFHKDKSRFPAAAETTASPPPPPMDEAAAEAKIKQLVSATSSETSDYIFATPGLDMRVLGRIDGWVSQIEQKDKYANGHARQVSEYACAIARESGMSQEDVDMVRQAALVHDLGKLGASAQLLQKPDDQLSDPELITVMKHPIDGAELLDSFPDLKRLGAIVRSHHEEFDGNGYPAGLKGDEIPVAARIIHVANSYHSLTSQMRFGPGMDPTAAQQELAKGAGKTWDPSYVQFLIQAIMSKKVPASF